LLEEVVMFFHDKPGWGIALRIVLVLLLIGGAVWVTRAAFYQGYAAGVKQNGYQSGMFFGDGDKMESHHMDEFMTQQGYSNGMFFHHQGGSQFYRGYPGTMGYPARGGFGMTAVHFLLGILGVILLFKLVMGRGGMRYYGHRWMARDAEGKLYPHAPYYHHHCQCPCCTGEDGDQQTPEAPAEEKPTRKAGKTGK
jgi:hypothetical protein